MQLRQSTQSFAKGAVVRCQEQECGFTVVELLVAMTLGLILLTMVMQTTMANRNLYSHDVVRTRVSQDIRSSLDILGQNIREAGENLTKTFPAVEITNGASGAPDEIILRRNLLDEVLKLCTAISAGSTTTQLYFANTSAISGCDYTSNTHNFTEWQTYRLADSSHQVKAFIYDSGTRLGEWFTYTGETNTGTRYYISRSAGSWTNSYTTTSSAIFLVEEWRFKVASNTLQLIVDNDTANTMNVAFGITDLQFQALMEDGTTQNSFARTDDWTTINTIGVTATGQDTFSKRTISTTLSAQFFPRNILSN